MKRIFGFLLTIGLLFSFADEVFAQVRVNGKVRWGIETKTVTQAEADSWLTSNGGVGYVDLWTYMCYSQEWVDQGYIQLDPSDGKIIQVNIAASASTQSFKMVQKSGSSWVDDQSVSVAQFAPRSGLSCGTNIFQPTMSPFAASGGFIAICPTWAYGTGTANSSEIVADPEMGLTTDVIKNSRTEVIKDENGKTWYAVKMYRLRFIYKQAKSFHAQFYMGESATGTDVSNGSCTFNIYDNQGRVIQGTIASGWTWSDGDWSKYHGSNHNYNYSSDYFGYIVGGVEVIADPDMQLTAEATCGGIDATGKLTVNDWAEKTWADYSGVDFYVNTTGGTRKKLTAGTHITTTPSVPTSGTAAPIDYILTPAGYTISPNVYADSLIWVIKGTFLA